MIVINDNLENRSPKSLDNKRGVFEGGAWRPYNSKAEVLSSVDLAYRFITMEVDIKIAGETNTYWFRDGVTLESDLVPKGGVILIPIVKTDADLDDTTYSDAIVLPLTLSETATILGLIRINYYDTDDTTLLSYELIAPSYDTINSLLLGFTQKVPHTKIFITTT